MDIKHEIKILTKWKEAFHHQSVISLLQWLVVCFMWMLSFAKIFPDSKAYRLIKNDDKGFLYDDVIENEGTIFYLHPLYKDAHML